MILDSFCVPTSQNEKTSFADRKQLRKTTLKWNHWLLQVPFPMKVNAEGLRGNTALTETVVTSSLSPEPSKGYKNNPVLAWRRRTSAWANWDPFDLLGLMSELSPNQWTNVRGLFLAQLTGSTGKFSQEYFPLLVTGSTDKFSQEYFPLPQIYLRPCLVQQLQNSLLWNTSGVMDGDRLCVCLWIHVASVLM